MGGEIMPLFGRRKEKKENAVVSLSALADEFLSLNEGELDLAWFAEQEGSPFELPIVKFREFVESKGIRDVPEDELRKSLAHAFKSRLSRMSGPSIVR